MSDIFERAESLRAESRYSDALNLYKKALKSQGESASLLIAIGDTYRMTGGFTLAEKHYARAIRIAGKTPQAVDATVGLALSRRALGDWAAALKLIAACEAHYVKVKDSEGIAFCLWAKAGALRIKGDIPEAISTFKKALRMFAAQKNDHGAGYCLCGLGGTSRVRGLYGDSLKYYLAANGLFRKLRDRFGIAYSYCGIGNAIRMMNRPDEAKGYFRKATAIYRRMGDIVSYSYTLWSMGKTYMAMGKSSMSERYLKEAEGNFKKTRDPRGVIYCTMGYAELEYIAGRPERALKLAEKAVLEARKYGFSVELCHAVVLKNLIDGKTPGDCYKRLRLKLGSTYVPMNIP